MPVRPNLFLIGAMKAGTTSLSRWLSQSAEIFTPRIKEPNHFARELFEAGIMVEQAANPHLDVRQFLNSGKSAFHAYVEKLDDYLTLYEGSGSYRYRLDASTNYLHSPVAAKEIHAFNSESKIIAILRDPAERAWSEFLMNVRIGICEFDCQAALDREWRDIQEGRIPLFERYVSAGLYQNHIQRYLELFDEANVLVLQFNEFHTDPGAIKAAVREFLQLDDLPDTIGRENTATVPIVPLLNVWFHRSGMKRWLLNNLPKRIVKSLRQRLYAPAKRLFYMPATRDVPENFRRIVEERLSELARMHRPKLPLENGTAPKHSSTSDD